MFSIPLLILLAMVVIVTGLAFYAGRLLRMLKAQHQRQQQDHTEKLQHLKQSIEVIGKAMQEQQCELSEGALRICVLLDHMPADNRQDPAEHYPSLWQMYQTVKDMPTHKARKQQAKQQTYEQDKIRLQAEYDLKEQINDDVGRLLVFIRNI